MNALNNFLKLRSKNLDQIDLSENYKFRNLSDISNKNYSKINYEINKNQTMVVLSVDFRSNNEDVQQCQDAKLDNLIKENLKLNYTNIDHYSIQLANVSLY